jgi:hypothetical protein
VKPEAPNVWVVVGNFPSGNAGKKRVKAHMRSILSKLAANDRTHTVTIALKRGILDF